MVFIHLEIHSSFDCYRIPASIASVVFYHDWILIMSQQIEYSDNILLRYLYPFLLPLYFFIITIALRPEKLLHITGAEAFVKSIAVVAVFMLITIFLMRFIYRYVFRYVSEALWYTAELLMLSVVFAVYLGLPHLIYSILYIVLVLALPVFSIYMGHNLIYALRCNEELSAVDKMRFYDNKGRLKIVLPVESVIYIKADDNDIRINYLDAEVPREIVIRNSMRAINELCQYHGLLRAHRSYFINPRHLTWLGRDDNDEVYAILDVPDMPHIPVTKRYFNRIVEKLS